jgi:protein-S-isoprenylcysteine O-methyltransferase Ste14
MFVFVRALTYATLFIGAGLVLLPARLLSWSGAVKPPGIGIAQVTGFVAATAGAGIAVWCILTFALVGRGTPAPFDPPRHLVVRGPYKYVRNPMYLGAAAALAGAALFHGSVALALYAATFLLVMHLFVVGYEEPALRATFGTDYERYRRQVRRWWPALTAISVEERRGSA